MVFARRVLPGANALSPAQAFAKEKEDLLVREHMPRDDEITAEEVNYLDQDNTFHSQQPLADLFESYDREVYALVQINHHQSNALPMCKVLTHTAAEELQQRKISEAINVLKKKPSTPAGGKGRRNFKNKEVRPKGKKELQLSWAIAPNDLGHRLKKMAEFLKKGNKVTLMIAGKKGMAKVPLEQMEELIKSVRNAVEETGAKEYKPMEGKVGAQVLLHLQGRLLDKDGKFVQQPDEDSDEDSDSDSDDDSR